MVHTGRILDLLTPPEQDEAEDRIGILIGSLDTLIHGVKAMNCHFTRMTRAAERGSTRR